MSDEKRNQTKTPADPYNRCGDEGAPGKGLERRTFLKGLGIAAASLAMPHVWVPNKALAQTSARGQVKHVLFIRLAGGFRFTAAFNGEVASRYNPFGRASSTATGTEWGAGQLTEMASWLDGTDGQARQALGMRPLNQISNDIAVLPCVDHEPFAARADGNHASGLERFLKGKLGAKTSIFALLNYTLRNRPAPTDASVALPAVTIDDAGMAQAADSYAPYRPPVLQSGGLADFSFELADGLPAWAKQMAEQHDQRIHDRVNAQQKAKMATYMQTRRDAADYAGILADPALDIRNGSTTPIDGLSNADLELMFGDDTDGRSVRLALRLFKFGCPAVYVNQGGYDFHSGEEDGLPPVMEQLNRLLSGLNAALKAMTHPDGGTYWDHTLVVCGSEFGRTARTEQFNSARGSDHTGDNATRWMSMPIMGGAISRAGNGGRSFGATRPDDLVATGKVYSYRSTIKTLMDVLGGDHRDIFTGDQPFDDLFR